MSYPRTKHEQKVQANKNKIVFYLFLPLIFIIGAFFGGFIAVASSVTDENSTELIMSNDTQENSKINNGITTNADPEFIPLECELSEELQEYTYYLCQDYKVDFYFVMGLMFTESAFVTDSVSDTDDYGLMQINTCNAADLSDKLEISDLLEPYQNIQAGVYILKGLFEKYDDKAIVCMAYNMGEYGASQLWNSGIYSTMYSEKVLSKAEEYSLQTEVSE